MSQDLAHTPLYELHRSLGARIVPFAGFAMPVQYRSILAEHRAVREHAGLFDVSHMGQFDLVGNGAEASLERLLTCPVATLQDGQVRYGLLCNDAGGVVDDVTVYRRAAGDFFVCVNAANIEKDFAWIESHLDAGTTLRDRSSETALLALQGPSAKTLLLSLCDVDLSGLRRFRFLEARVANAPCLISRTGYTGSDGYELYVAAAEAESLFRALLAAGDPVGLEPAGLGARDTLRIEAALPLYGHELDDDTTPLEAGLDRFVKRDPGGFIGATALENRVLAKRLVGFVLDGPGVARADHAIESEGQVVGRVTSGAPSPTLGKSIGLGYVPPALAAEGVSLAVRVRNRKIAATVVPTPFFRRAKPTPR